ncbi:MAG TPA: cation:dicarboxylase symporter family transporter [Thermoanaerobaculia bacterium]|nr:cation:dicarboxylase symporter family transporter [Thermoanaerobaculia bacterium]
MWARPRTLSFTTWSLLALAAALALGAWGHWSGAPAFFTIESIVKPLGALWLAALQMAVLPLVVLKLLAAIVGAPTNESFARLGLRTLLLFVAMLIAAAVLTLIIAPPFIALYQADAATLATLRATTEIPPDAAAAGAATSWPRNVIASASKGDLLPVLLFTAVFAIAITRLPDEQRVPLTNMFQSLGAAMLVVVRWILIGTPIGVFALTYTPALRAGAGAAGMLGAFVVLVSGLLLIVTLLLYPMTAIAGRISIRKFARAVAPAQLVAVSTRSSIASLPALIEGAAQHLRLPASATSFVLPLTVAVFKINRPISTTAKLLFVAHVYNVPLSASTIVVFLATVILLSFSAVGVPDGGMAFSTLPAYLAAGLPIEGIIVLEATTTIPDIFKTLVNVTADMSAAAMLSRSHAEAADPVEDLLAEGAAS